MTREEHETLVQNIMNSASNQAELSLLLTQLTEDYEKVLTESETATKSVTDLTADNENLRKVNMQLFLKVGHKDAGNQNNKEGSNGKEGNGEEGKTASFEELFDEKGELK